MHAHFCFYLYIENRGQKWYISKAFLKLLLTLFEQLTLYIYSTIDL